MNVEPKKNGTLYFAWFQNVKHKPNWKRCCNVKRQSAKKNLQKHQMYAHKKYICKATLHFNIVLWECVQTVFGEIQLVSTNQMKYANRHDGQLNVPHIIRTLL